MLGFIHPRPPSRKEVAMQIMRQERKTIATNELTVDPPGGPVAAPPDAMPVRFSGACTLREYCSLLRDHLAFLARHDSPAARRAKLLWPLALGMLALVLAWAVGPGGWRTGLLAGAACALAWLPFMTNVWIALIAPPVFYAKRWRAPVCEFHIDASGIERRAGHKRSLRRWDEVRAVRRYRSGYLLMFASGAIPIPFRCLSREDEVRLRAFCAAGRFGDQPAEAAASS
ncbi:YcxB family protein [Massilia sp. AB1]|uniref:YcxB family protein n=1 Tax=Massilia sp. AB1 TaxID=2823371 RepID=UPI001B82CCEB|nr:YcxB family protein [Massilia sp. AB1]MBQ5942238.1 YcxB family protein [Massilia sp. AB1]